MAAFYSPRKSPQFGEKYFFSSALFARSQLTTATAIDANWPQSEELSPGDRLNVITYVSLKKHCLICSINRDDIHWY